MKKTASIPYHLADLNSSDQSSGILKKLPRIAYHSASIICIGLVVSSLFSVDKSASRALAAFKKINPGATITSTTIRGSLVEVTAKNRTVYATLDGKWFLSGQLFNGSTGEVITAGQGQAVQQVSLPSPQQTDQQPQKIPQSTLNSLSAFAIPGGSQGKPRLTILSDPDCSYCRQLNTQLKQLSDQIETQTLLFPIEELHPGSTEKSSNIWCHKDRGIALESAFNGELIEIADAGCKASSVLTAIAEFADQNGFTGTPVLIAEDGRVHQGYLTAQQIKQWLNTHN